MKFIKTCTFDCSPSNHINDEIKVRLPSGGPNYYFNNLRLSCNPTVFKKVSLLVNGFVVSYVEGKFFNVLRQYQGTPTCGVPLNLVSDANYLSSDYDDVVVKFIGVPNDKFSMKVWIDVYEDDPEDKVANRITDNKIDTYYLDTGSIVLNGTSYGEYMPHNERLLCTFIKRSSDMESISLRVYKKDAALTTDTVRNVHLSHLYFNSDYLILSLDYLQKLFPEYDTNQYDIVYRISFKQNVNDKSVRFYFLYESEINTNLSEINYNGLLYRIKDKTKNTIEYKRYNHNIYQVVSNANPTIIFVNGATVDSKELEAYADGVYGLSKKYANIEKITVYEKKTVDTVIGGYIMSSVIKRATVNKLYSIETAF